MRFAISVMILAMLASCNRAPAANDAAGTSNSSAAASAQGDAALAQWRADVLNGCIGGARDTVRDPNVPVERHCTCAVDRIMAGKSLAELEADERTGAHAAIFQSALRQCIHEISPDFRTGQPG